MKLILILSLFCSTLVIGSEKETRHISHTTDPKVEQIPSCDPNQRSPPKPTHDEDHEDDEKEELVLWDENDEQSCDKDCADTCPEGRSLEVSQCLLF